METTSNTNTKPFQDLTSEFAACMRRNNVKRASGSWDEYERAKKIALTEIKTDLKTELLERVYQWILPRDQ